MLDLNLDTMSKPNRAKKALNHLSYMGDAKLKQMLM
jgi:hypothetical protein